MITFLTHRRPQEWLSRSSSTSWPSSGTPSAGLCALSSPAGSATSLLTCLPTSASSQAPARYVLATSTLYSAMQILFAVKTARGIKLPRFFVGSRAAVIAAAGKMRCDARTVGYRREEDQLSGGRDSGRGRRRSPVRGGLLQAGGGLQGGGTGEG